MTTLQTACKSAIPILIREALAEGHNPHGTDTQGGQAFHWLATSGSASPSQCKECLDLLLDAGCSLVDQDRLGRTPLYLAVLNGRYEVAADMILVMQEKGLTSAFEARTNRGRTVLQLACDPENGHSRTATLLLLAGADPMPHLQPGSSDQSPMSLASKRGAGALCQLLYALGADSAQGPLNLQRMSRLEASVMFPSVLMSLLEERSGPLEPDEFDKLCERAREHSPDTVALVQSHQAKRSIEALRTMALQHKR